jgi:hypothetical protein
MGEAELESNRIIIHSHIITYGNAADEALTEQIRDEIETMWNEPKAVIDVHNKEYLVQFRITAELKKDITELEVLQNTDPRNNYFRIEEFIHGNISFVDGLGCNSGYFLLENLYKGSTTAAHEYGHTLGLDHPDELDIRGQGVPGIMYPRGTLVDPQYQYDSTIPVGKTGGTMHPMFRKVLLQDILDLKLHRLSFNNNRAIVGEYTNIYHWDHRQYKNEDFGKPPIRG